MFDILDKATSVTESDADIKRREASDAAMNEANVRQQAFASWRGMNITKQFTEQLQDVIAQLNEETEAMAFNGDNTDILRSKTIEKATLRKVISCITNNTQYK